MYVVWLYKTIVKEIVILRQKCIIRVCCYRSDHCTVKVYGI